MESEKLFQIYFLKIWHLKVKIRSLPTVHSAYESYHSNKLFQKKKKIHEDKLNNILNVHINTFNFLIT